MPRLSSTLIFAFLVLVVSVSAVSASPDTWREKRQERIETLIMWKMMEALDLDKATSDKVFAIRRKYLHERSRLRKAVRADIDRLRHLLTESRQDPDDNELGILVKSIFDNRKKLRKLWEEQYLEVSKVLTVRQQAELVLFLKDFRRELRQILHRDRPDLPANSSRSPGRPPHGPKGPELPKLSPLPPLPTPPPHGQPPGPPSNRPSSDSPDAPDEPLDEP